MKLSKRPHKNTTQLLQGFYLIFLFAVSFSVPLYVAYEAAVYLKEPATVQAQKNIDPIFPDSIPITNQGSHIRLKHQPLLNPIEGKDFLISFWVKIRQMPSSDERMVLFSKQDFTNSLQPGYSLSIARYGNSLRPLVYWRDLSGKGGWYRFADLELHTKTWYMFALSFRDGTRLGLHVAEAEPGKKPKRELLGGFQLSVPVLPDATSDLILGSPRNGTLRGKLGPIGIFSGVYLKKHFEDIFRDLSRNPLALPSAIKEKDIVFWSIDGENDLSPLKHEVLRAGNEKSRRSEN